jgi:hypothetical protein
MPEPILRVCVIAPEAPNLPPLQWIREIGALGRPGVEVSITGGLGVDEERASQALRSGADVVIWSGHGRENGLALSNGAIVSGRWIAAQVRASPPRAMVLAACGSREKDAHLESLAATVSKAGVTVVGFPPGLPDAAAVAYNVEFVRTMSASRDVGESHDVALERLAAQWPDVAREIELMPGLTNGLRSLYDRLAAVEREQKRQAVLVEAIAIRLGVEVARLG